MLRRAFVGAFLLLLTSIFIAQPALAQTVTWHADYFNNGQLSGAPAFTRTDPSIAFNWGSGSPGSGINNDNFSVRWATDVSLPAGTYRFYAQADDNIRVIFNFGYQPIIDTFASNKVNQLITADVNVAQAGTYHIQVDYRELTDQAFAYLSFANLSTNPGGPNFATPSSPLPVSTGSWTAQYYGNANLTGDPVAIITEAGPSHHWGSAAPFPSLPADNFSARWTSTQNLSGGTYNLSVAADDGVRVWVNGTLTIDQWHAASGQTYNANLTLPAGPNYFQVEYYEGSGEAFIDFNLTQTSGGAPAPTQAPPPTNASATITAYRLNVRATPDGINGQILTRVSRLEVYPIVAKNADGSWYQLNINGVLGWVNGSYINVVNGANVPIAGSSQGVTTPSQPALTGNTLTAPQFNVVVRSGPGTQFRRTGLLPVGGVAQLIGRNGSNTWWQINLNGLVGWVSAQFTTVSSTANFNSIPVTG